MPEDVAASMLRELFPDTEALPLAYTPFDYERLTQNLPSVLAALLTASSLKEARSVAQRSAAELRNDPAFGPGVVAFLEDVSYRWEIAIQQSPLSAGTLASAIAKEVGVGGLVAQAQVLHRPWREAGCGAT
jgi:hypothetical protein